MENWNGICLLPNWPSTRAGRHQKITHIRQWKTTQKCKIFNDLLYDLALTDCQRDGFESRFPWASGDITHTPCVTQKVQLRTVLSKLSTENVSECLTFDLCIMFSPPACWTWMNMEILWRRVTHTPRIPYQGDCVEDHRGPLQAHANCGHFSTCSNYTFYRSYIFLSLDQQFQAVHSLLTRVRLSDARRQWPNW